MGGGGGPLAFLNKKTWHTGSLRVMEEVWKREQEHEKEQRHLEELKKQLDEERQLEELEKAATDAGHTKKSNCLEWMYGGSFAAKGDAERRQQEAEAMSKPAQLEDEEQKTSRVEKVALLPSFYVEDTPRSANEAWARLNNDPLFMIKRQEQSALQKIRSNPVQMQAIKDEVKKLQSLKSRLKKEKKTKKEKKSKERKEKKRKRAEDSLPNREEERAQKERHVKSTMESGKEDGGQQLPKKDSKVNSNYGLSKGTHSHGSHDAGAVASETRKRLEEAGRRKIQEERKKSEMRSRRREYRVGQISDHVRQERLAEMKCNAQHREELRGSMLRRERLRDLEEERDAHEASAKHKPKDFAHNTANTLYSAGERSLENSVTSRRHYSQRTRESDRRI